MNNEIGRKITSLTLMTIMLAGGMTFAIPGEMPTALADSKQTANLEVSNTNFGGPMVVQVMVNDSNYKDDDVESMPRVTVDGNDFVLAQGSDGNWYGFFADTSMAALADASGTGFEFGEIKDELELKTLVTGAEFDDDAVVYVNATNNIVNVVKNPRSLDISTGAENDGQIGVDANSWPFIQTFDFTDDANIPVIYDGSTDQQIPVKYTEDMDDYATFSLDREKYPHNADIHLQISDHQLNIDPTDEDLWAFDVVKELTYYGNNAEFLDKDEQNSLFYGDNGFLSVTQKNVIKFHDNTDSFAPANNVSSYVVVVKETSPNTGLFENTDSGNHANMRTTADVSLRGITGTIDYNDSTTSILLGFFTGSVLMDVASIVGDWTSGESLAVQITDADEDKNTKISNDFDVSVASFKAIPSIKIGSPITLDDKSTVELGAVELDADNYFFDTYSKRLIVTANGITTSSMTINYNLTVSDLQSFISEEKTFNFFNYDLDSFDIENVKVGIVNVDNSANPVDIGTGPTGYDLLSEDVIDNINLLDGSYPLSLTVEFDSKTLDNGDHAFVADFVRYAGTDGRTNDSIYRMEAEETTSSSGIFEGTVEYVMLNQVNVLDKSTFTGLTTIGQDIDIIVHEDLSGGDAVAVNYLDADGQGERTTVSDQLDATTNSANVSFDATTYKVGDTVTFTIEDGDLNTSSDEIDTFSVVSSPADILVDKIGKLGGHKSSLVMDITINDHDWVRCLADNETINGLGGSMNTITESGKDTGVFTGTFHIPHKYCEKPASSGNNTGIVSSGKDIKINYHDYRDASGEPTEVGDSAGIRANTGSVSFDRTVYGVPFGVAADFDSSETTPALFAIHETGIGRGETSSTEGKHLTNGDLMVHIRVNDPDFDVAASGEDKIALDDETNGPVTVKVIRGGNSVILGTAGAAQAVDGKITTGDTTVDEGKTIEYGPITEIAPDSGIFEWDLTIRYTDGPSGTNCPDSTAASLDHIDTNSSNHCIMQGDILTVEYTDPTDASGNSNSVTDSATFDLRNGVLQSDKSVYIIGSDMILTLIEPDFDLDNDNSETYDLDIIEWDSDAKTLTMGNQGGFAETFDPEPSDFRETGDNTGIFQVIVEIPSEIDGDSLERGEEILLEYQDWGPSGANYVGDENEDVNLTVFTSNFGATVELDQKVYTWTDKVFITIVAPDHNFDSDLIDEIGDTEDDPIRIATQDADIDNYRLVESGTDTGIFTGEVILTGFKHDANGDGDGKDAPYDSESGTGPTDGFLPSSDDDGISITFEYSNGENVISSALIRWNIGEVQWLEASYPASGTGVVRVIDPDMNLNPESVDNFDVKVNSDSDAGGITLTVTETNEATGIFEGTVFYTTTDSSSGHRLRVAEGDTVTAEYEDHTLPKPYNTSNELDVTATTLIGTIVPPLERAPAANLRTIDAFGNSLNTVTVDQQVQISADLNNGQDREQMFAYLVQVQNDSGVTVSLAWITGSLNGGQSFSPALSWIPTESGSYTATAFVWESVDNPTALSPPASITVNVS